MAPKRKTENRVPSSDLNGIFSGMRVFLVETGVQRRRLQIWKQKLVQMGATLESRISKSVTHVFAADPPALLRHVDRGRLDRFNACVLAYQWLEDSLKLGEREPEDPYRLKIDAEGEEEDGKNKSVTDEISPLKKTRASHENGGNLGADGRQGAGHDAHVETPSSPGGSGDLYRSPSPANATPGLSSTPEKDVRKFLWYLAGEPVAFVNAYSVADRVVLVSVGTCIGCWKRVVIWSAYL